MEVISVESLSVAYKLYPKPTDLLRDVLFGGKRHETFWALRDVCLSVKEGERVGIVGPNGAGKSTLLKTIAGNLSPTKGEVKVVGKISSLLSMVPAWNEESNGIENIRFNLLLQGVSDQKITRAVEDIIEFTELGPFIYRPVKTYSTGMGARLSFAIATATEPDILIVDEILGTGDGYFAAKAHRRMQEFCDRGRALLFVSHSIAAVQQMCSRVIWMQHGGVRLDGAAEAVLPEYEADYRKSEDEAVRKNHLMKLSHVSSAPSADEIGDEGLRLRIVPKGGAHFSTNHYVRNIVVKNALLAEPVNIPLTMPLNLAPSVSSLDLLSSEWGRLHERFGIECRLLQRATGRNSGGHIILDHELARVAHDGRVSLNVTIEVASHNKKEVLGLEALDLQAGRWTAAELLRCQDLEDGWQEIEFRLSLELPREEVATQLRQQLIETGKVGIEILSVDVRVNEQSTTSLMQFEPFKIVVELNFLKPIPICDVCLRISRSDGVHVFWQSSGLADGNISGVLGRCAVEFDFGDNVFGSGDYYVHAVVANGWNYPDNFPYSEIFCRSLNAASFRVIRKLSEVDFGLIAKCVPVEIRSF
jgi:lipopolysaccharide transport system ATP-binding protein